MSPKPVVFLDRDGVLNRRIMDGYVTCLEEFDILPGVLPSLALLNRAGFRLAVVTNQRGIALGRMTQMDVDAVHQHLREQAASHGAELNEFYVCPHHRDAGCPCRKPEAGLLDQAFAHAPLEWSRAFLIGDSDTDIQAGKKRGVTTIKVAGPSRVGADYTFETFSQAAMFLATTQAKL